MVFRPLGSTVYFAARGAARSSSDGAPFYLRPFVVLRGVQAMRYQGERAAEVEVELRWQAHPRFSVVGFAGAGVARTDAALADRDKTVTSGGGGFRYLLARTYGLHMASTSRSAPTSRSSTSSSAAPGFAHDRRSSLALQQRQRAKARRRRSTLNCLLSV
jgi:hypothetical protein